MTCLPPHSRFISTPTQTLSFTQSAYHTINIPPTIIYERLGVVLEDSPLLISEIHIFNTDKTTNET